jgi:hypothetical protein
MVTPKQEELSFNLQKPYFIRLTQTGRKRVRERSKETVDVR